MHNLRTRACVVLAVALFAAAFSWVDGQAAYLRRECVEQNCKLPKAHCLRSRESEFTLARADCRNVRHSSLCKKRDKRCKKEAKTAFRKCKKEMKKAFKKRSTACRNGFKICKLCCKYQQTGGYDRKHQVFIDCTFCGNGVKYDGEECDDGTLNSDTAPDACRMNCLLPWCGDSVTDSGEECDDGNAGNGDGCETDCVLTPLLTTTSTNTTTTTTLPCNCCSGDPELLLFETGIPSGTCGALRAFRCSKHSSSACTEDSDCNFGTCLIGPNFCWSGSTVGPPCTQDEDCVGTCEEFAFGNLPMDLECGSGYAGGGNSAVPQPIPTPDRGRPFLRVTNCDSVSGVLTLGPTTPAQVGERHCTSGRKCSSSGMPCVMDWDCPPAETCDTQCLFGAPVPMPNLPTPATSFCMVNHIAEEVSGTAQCAGGDVDVDVAVRAVVYLNGDLLQSSRPPNVPGIQPCPLCDYLCQGGPKDRFPCDDDSDCPRASCGTTTQCLGSVNDGTPCTPETSDSEALGDVENAYPTSHDCWSDPSQDVTASIGGLPLFFNLTTGTDEWNAVDRPNGSRVFCGYCRDVIGTGSLCFEGGKGANCPNTSDPACQPSGYTGDRSGCGNAVPCDSHADCDDGDEYESCVQRNPGAFGEAASTRISVAGSTDGKCLADGQPHSADLVSIFCYPPTFNATTDAATDLSGPGLILLQGDMKLQ